MKFDLDTFMQLLYCWLLADNWQHLISSVDQFLSSVNLSGTLCSWLRLWQPHGSSTDISLSGGALTHSDIMLLSHPPDGNHIAASTWLLSSPAQAPSVSNHLLHSPTWPIVHQLAPHASNLPISIHTSSPSLFVSLDANHLFTYVQAPRPWHSVPAQTSKEQRFNFTCIWTESYMIHLYERMWNVTESVTVWGANFIFTILYLIQCESYKKRNKN